MDITMKNSAFNFKLVALLVAIAIIAGPILTSSHSVYASNMEPQGLEDVAVWIGGKIIGFIFNKGLEWAWTTVPTVITAPHAAAVLAFAAIAGGSLVGIHLATSGSILVGVNGNGCHMSPGQTHWDCPLRLSEDYKLNII